MLLFGYRYYTGINTAIINQKYGNTGPNISTGTVSPTASCHMLKLMAGSLSCFWQISGCRQTR